MKPDLKKLLQIKNIDNIKISNISSIGRRLETRTSPPQELNDVQNMNITYTISINNININTE